MKRYSRPSILSETCFETSALSCGKMATPMAGSHHFASAYDTVTGHLGPGFGASESVSPAQVGIGFGPGGTSMSASWGILCGTWVTAIT